MTVHRSDQRLSSGLLEIVRRERTGAPPPAESMCQFEVLLDQPVSQVGPAGGAGGETAQLGELFAELEIFGHGTERSKSSNQMFVADVGAEVSTGHPVKEGGIGLVPVFVAVHGVWSAAECRREGRAAESSENADPGNVIVNGWVRLRVEGVELPVGESGGDVVELEAEHRQRVE